MDFMTAIIIFSVNFVILYLVVMILSHFSMKRKKELEELLELKVQKEEDRLEELSNDLLKIADVLLVRLEEKEKEINKLVEKVENSIQAVEIYDEPVSTQPPKKKSKKRTVGRVRVERHELLKQSKEYLDADSKFKEIYFLADKGEDIEKIAKKTGKTKGEVELVLSLRDAKKGT